MRNHRAHRRTEGEHPGQEHGDHAHGRHAHRHPALRRNRVGHYIGARLHRRLFFQLGITIFVTLLMAGVVAHLTAPDVDWGLRRSRIERFAAASFQTVWRDPAQRRRFSEEVSEAFGVHLALTDAHGKRLLTVGGDCRDPWATLAVESSVTGTGEPLGFVAVCGGPPAPGGRLRFLWILLSAGIVVWLAAGIIARRLGRPLWQLAEVTTRIGEGDLRARVRLGRHQGGEVGALAHSVNEMAARIEKQMSDQRELLAGVSHEIRTPLARLRVIVEMLRDQAAPDERLLTEAEREVLEVDDLTSRLLAASRLEFVALDRRPLDTPALCVESLRRAGLPESLFHLETKRTEVAGDPTLLGRALLNLLKNAQAHGQGVRRLSLSASEDQRIHFRVWDNGPGIESADLPRFSRPFVQGSSSAPSHRGSLGLGLALVRRIAETHGGELSAGKTEEGGSFVEFSVTPDS